MPLPQSRTPRRRQGVRRDPGAGEARDRARGQRARARRVALLDRSRSRHGLDRTTAPCRGSGSRRQAVGYARRAANTRRVAPAVDDGHRENRHSDAGEAVEPEVVAGRHHREADPGRPERPERLGPPATADREEDDADDQRVGGVQARHRGVRVGGQVDEAVAVRVDEADAEQPRRRGRHEDVAEQPDHVREQDRVAERDELLVAPQVDPEHREAEDRELRQPVRPRDGGLEQVPLVDEVLERQLVQPVRDPRLQMNDVVAVRERLRGVAVGEPACELIEDGEAEPDRQLATEVRPPTRQMTPPGCDHGGHLFVF